MRKVTKESDETSAPSPERVVGNRRLHRRKDVPAVAAVAGSDGDVVVWLVENLSLGGASLVGGELLIPGQQIRLTLFVAGQPPLALGARVLRRQVSTVRRRAAIAFDGSGPAHETALTAALESAAVAQGGAPATVLVVARASQSLNGLLRQLRGLGHEPRVVESPLEAAAWLQAEPAVTTVLCEEKLMEVQGFRLLAFVRETAPQRRRIVIPSEVNSFRLSLVLRAGLADAALEKPFKASDVLRTVGHADQVGRARRRAR